MIVELGVGLAAVAAAYMLWRLRKRKAMLRKEASQKEREEMLKKIEHLRSVAIERLEKRRRRRPEHGRV